MLSEWRSSYYPKDIHSDEDSRAERMKRVVAGQFIMQRDAPGGAKQFRAFVNIQAAYDFIISQALEDRTFYETIFAEHRQKPHFDLDIVPSSDDPMSHTDLLNLLLTEIKRIIGPEFDLINDVGVYSSHAEDGKKRSYHVILTGYFVNDNIEAGRFAKAVRDGMVAATDGIDSPAGIFIKKCVDLVVYKKIQQFRLLGCTKLGHNRHKTVVLEYSAAGRARKRNPIINPYVEFCNSLIAIIGGEPSTELKLLEPKYYTIPTPVLTQVEETLHAMMRRRLHSGFVASDEYSLWIFEAKKIICHLIDKLHLPGTLAGNCRYHTVSTKQQGALIALRAPRAGGYWCILCERQHDHENPYLTLHTDETSTAATTTSPRVVAIIYRCHRDPTRSIRICSMRGGGGSSDAGFTCEQEPHDPRIKEIFVREIGGPVTSAVDA